MGHPGSPKGLDGHGRMRWCARIKTSANAGACAEERQQSNTKRIRTDARHIPDGSSWGANTSFDDKCWLGFLTFPVLLCSSFNRMYF